ncbi:DBH-like monooxygenase protein 1 [Plakobranchus ocellatus]|uniref:DBH-like monooxygenase protein 1 n=1 Tax=Plakobranchus ocellatus TaxID=259542 RepID=A0AAV3YC42_9GAST|nr:DBH-like monooxygenase protein 1 [Plakobranchus ocellatus]
MVFQPDPNRTFGLSDQTPYLSLRGSRVGHENRPGGGKRNPFGVDFAKFGHTWNEDLCRADSDGDGLTNGYELGDPDCTWSPGQIPSRSVNITHPGVCDNVARCEEVESFANCSNRKFNCPRTEEAGVKHLNLTFQEITIPSRETNYFCMTFDLPQDQDYHVIGDEPIIDNEEVLHHIVVYGCEQGKHKEARVPKLCDMGSANYGCHQIIGLWGFGHLGTCFRNDTGFRIGRSSFRRVLLEASMANFYG